jgi:hypothetical protein
MLVLVSLHIDTLSASDNLCVRKFSEADSKILARLAERAKNFGISVIKLREIYHKNITQ